MQVDGILLVFRSDDAMMRYYFRRVLIRGLDRGREDNESAVSSSVLLEAESVLSE